MNRSNILLTLLIASGHLCQTPYKHQSTLPLIGILSQDTSSYIKKFTYREDAFWSYVAGSYVDWIGQAGAMPVLIPFDLPRKELDFYLQHLDMFLLPGGGADLIDQKNATKTTPVQDTAHYIINWVKKKNDEGRYYPLFATCLGFEQLIISENNQGTDALDCSFEDEHKNHTVIINEEGLKNSKLWRKLDQERIRDTFASSVLYFTHTCGIEKLNWTKYSSLKNDYWVIGTTKQFGDNPREFISSIEHKKYPIFSNQWHPEKNQYERGDLYSFLDRSEPTIDLMHNLIASLVETVRPTAKSLKDIPPAVQVYFSSNRMPEPIPMSSYERVYVFSKKTHD